MSTEKVLDPNWNPDSIVGRWWSQAGERLQCDLCPRHCQLKPGDRGFCFVRENRDGQIWLNTYGRSTGFCIDPVEKKPLNHFYPGTPVLSFGTAGCNLGCKFCQNWDISKSKQVERISSVASPDAIANAAKQWNCRSVAYTYNDPIIWAEYAIDTARACRAAGIKNIAVTAGYITSEARREFFEFMDAANVDLKAFTEEFYQKITYSHLAPVLETLEYLQKETDVWFEITNLVIPGANDSTDELKQMCNWIVSSLGDSVPVHFSAFHPDFRMTDRPATPPETLIKAYEIAREIGLKFVYIGNIHDAPRQSTYCPACSALLIERDWYELGQYQLDGSRCRYCQVEIPGRWDRAPGNWGRRRQPVSIESFETPKSLPIISSTSRKAQSMTSSTTPSSATQSSDLPELSAPQEHAILRAASQIVTSSINHQNLPNPESLLGDLARTVVHGAFVTLKRGNHLRGCCGVLGQPMHLAHALFQSAVTTAREDKRLPPISPTEMPYLHMDVTLLGPMIVVSGKVHNRPSAFQIGTHGLRIAKGNQAGLLLPSVAIEQGWSAEEFLEGVCRKAGLPENAWQQPDTELAIFEGRKIEGQLDPADWKGRDLRAHDLLSPDQIGQLAVLTAENLFALHRGATPTYYASNLPDLNVAGVVLTLSTPGAEGEAAGAAQQYMKISLRPGIPLQSTLMELCQSAAPNLRNFGKSTPMRVDISILQDPALHGSLIDNELEGFQSTQRALMVSQPPRTGIVWKPNHQTEDLLNAAAKTARLRDGQASVISLAIGSTRDQLIVSSTPMPVIDQSPRPPAVAGSFYPKSDAARTELVRALFHGPQQKDKPAQPSPCLAIMLPHAGLLYSGQVAVDVLRRVQLPKTALIIGPKHTPHGADWAVSPHSRWHLSASAYLDADMELSNRIVENVSMMQLDALAHRQEHAIEVELPLLHFLNPEIRIAAIAMHGATWKELARAASQLANVISQLDEPPLLVISSDMNHFENDQETRRRDRLALDAIQQRDPEELLTRCKQHQISMCGQLPAALVMQTLLELGAPFRVEEVQYDTSARVSRDSSRVVGYAGLIFHSSIPSSPKS